MNRKAQVGAAYTELTRDAENRARPELIELLTLDDDGFRERFRQSAVLRAKPEGMRRNVCVALGNIADPETVAPLTRVLREDASPIVRGHAAWALGRIGTADAVAALTEALEAETDAGVLEEIREALGSVGDVQPNVAKAEWEIC